MIEIQHLNKGQLAEFVQSPAFQNLPNLPISAHRASAQCFNPRAGENDTLLLLAWLEGELVGYLGVLPDWYFPAEGDAEKCGWLSCLWVSDQHRGKSIAKLLVTQGVAAIGGRILLTEFTPQAKQLYDKLGFFDDLKISAGIRLYCRLELQRLLPPKGSVFEKIKPLFRVSDAVGNVLVDMVTRLRRPKPLAGICRYTRHIDDETAQFIAGKQESELFRRGQKELNWALENPWIRSGKPDEASRRYYFSSVDHQFEFVCVKVYDAENTLRAFLIFAKRNRTLKLPCCYLAEGAAPLVASVIQAHIREWGINTFSTFHSEMVQHYQTNRTFALHKKAITRHYLATHRLAESVAGHQFDIQDGDGDCFFT
jgi:GNAT superfamily N-acetyltransferase